MTVPPPDRRVLHVITSLGTGGAERSLLELVPALRVHGIEVTVATLAAPTGPRWSPAEVEVVDVAGRGPLGRARALRRLARDLGVDVVHSSIFDADMATRLARMTGRPPLVCSLVNTTYDAERLRHTSVAPIKIRAVQVIDAVSARAVDRFHALTGTVAASAARHLRLPRDRITVVPRGRDEVRLGSRTEERRHRIRGELGLSGPVVLTVGRQEEQKGQQFLLEAMPSILRTHPSATVLIAGREGGATHRLHATAESLGLGPRVRFLGHREDVGDLLCAADCFAFPSVYEGMGGAVLEAMALSVPIVASDLPVLREVLGDGSALFAPVADPGSLADQVNRVLDDPDGAAHRVSVARRRFEDTFTLDRAAAGMADLYRAVARPSGGRGSPGP